MLLEKYPADGSDTEKFIDPSKLKVVLPRLDKLEGERAQKQWRAKEQERQEAKQGAPENLSKELSPKRNSDWAWNNIKKKRN